MDATLSTLVLFLREAWTALAGALLAFAVLAGMAQILRLSSASVIGANLWVWEAISAVLSVSSWRCLLSWLYPRSYPRWSLPCRPEAAVGR
jgi:hypothetical protein